MSSTLGRNGLRVSALAAAIFACGLGTAATAADETWSQAPKSLAAIEREAGRELYIVGLKSPPVATYAGDRTGLPALRRMANGRLDVRSAEALAYVDTLQQEHAAFQQSAATRIGRALQPISEDFRFFHAYNGMVVALTEEEAARLVADPMVSALEPYQEFALTTDAGPNLIGAPTIWSGGSTPNNLATRGEGVVIGIIDSGSNLGSPSFADVDIDGYDHVNPLGSGNYLGWCNPTNPNHNPTRDVCNDKMIGGWDFTDTAFPAGQIEAAGFEDENGHGSHTASTAGGSRRNASIFGAQTTISGVAPRANLVTYDACYTNTAGQGLCPNVSTLGSINRAVADGIIDVVNYSISGSQTPWTDANAQAFLAAHNAGIFVAASAGNGTPTPGTTNHVAPWITTVAASTHDRAFFGNVMNFTNGPTPPPAATNVALRPGVNPPFISATLTNVPVLLSPTYGDGSVNNDGCTAFAPGTFVRGGEAAIALIRWGSAASACGTIARVNAAGAAGAAGVIFLADVPLNAGAGGTVPAWVIDDPAVVAAVRTQATSTEGVFADGFEPDPVPGDVARVTINFPGQGFPGQGDVMASFSLIGPTNFDLLKPDITGPGVNVLAAVARWNTTPAPGSLNPARNDAVGLLSGTSMSSPHLAGSAALLRALNRSWTPSQIKSAIVTTARTQNVFKFSATPPAAVPSDPFDRGGGRVDLTRAARAGLLLDETGANFTAANPATGGNPATLNLPSIQARACVGTCTFTRTVRSTRNQPTTWTASVAGLPGATVTPASFTLSNAATQVITVSIDGAQLSQTAFSFGEVVLTPNTTALVEQRMPVAVRAAAPDIAVSNTNGISVTVEAGSGDQVSFTVSNTGNPTINWELASGTQAGPLRPQPQVTNSGFLSAQFLGFTPPSGAYVADDFSVSGSAQVTTLLANGFVLPGGQNLSATNSPNINFHVYADAGGVPAGAPEGFGAPPVYSLRVPFNAPGLTLTGNNISLNLVTNGAPALNLTTGRYWLVVFPEMPGTGSGASAANPIWAWRHTGVAAPLFGGAPVTITPTAAGAAWAPGLSGGQPTSGLSMVINGSVGCGAPWLTAAPASGSLGALASTTVTLDIDASTLTPGTYGTYVCVSSLGTDPDEPMTFVPVTLTVNPPAP